MLAHENVKWTTWNLKWVILNIESWICGNSVKFVEIQKICSKICLVGQNHEKLLNIIKVSQNYENFIKIMKIWSKLWKVGQYFGEKKVEYIWQNSKMFAKLWKVGQNSKSLAKMVKILNI